MRRPGSRWMMTCGAVLSTLLACGEGPSTNGTGTGDMSSTTGGSTTANSASGTTTGTTATSDATGTTATTTGPTTGSTTGSTTGQVCPAGQSCLDGLICCDEGMACVNGVECYETCNPLQPECERFEHCTPGPDVPFICFQEGNPGAAGDPCDCSNCCDTGLLCLSGTSVQGCEGTGCCAPACDLSDPIACPGDMEVCQSWFEGEAPAGYENLGVCALPG